MKRAFVAGSIIVLVGLLSVLGHLPAAAQEVTAQVRTWTGQTVQLSEPGVLVFYTVIPTPQEEAPGTMAGMPGGGTRPEIRGSFQSIRQLIDTGPEPRRAQRDLEALTLSRAGVERRVPVEQIVSLTISRGQLAESALPPYVAPTHYRYSAVAQLVDGSRVEADYFNFGTAVVRGMAAGARVEIPFDEIETLRFDR
ncbi:MAG TPA: hypothetical protein VFR64_16755 [Methylomirabilota bacterium]|nr:hypothetical protein [Methylomirabilota bacterium]